MSEKKISVIIPTYNEKTHLAETIAWVFEKGSSQGVAEVLVIDGGSTDETLAVAEAAGAHVFTSPRKGRAAQMNDGAANAKNEILYFLHADTRPPATFAIDILAAVTKGFTAGCYMLSFDHSHWFLKANCWFTRFNISAFRYGDQSLFVTKEAFQNAAGFCENHIVMEDFDLIRRLRQKARFLVIKKPVRTSARKYLANGIYKTQAIFVLIFFMYHLGYSQQTLLATYRRFIQQDKI